MRNTDYAYMYTKLTANDQGKVPWLYQTIRTVCNTSVGPSITGSQLTTAGYLQHRCTILIVNFPEVLIRRSNLCPICIEPTNLSFRFRCTAVYADVSLVTVPCDFVKTIAIDSKCNNAIWTWEGKWLRTMWEARSSSYTQKNNPAQNKGFSQPNRGTSILWVTSTHPPPPFPNLQLAQSLSPKSIAGSGIMKLFDAYLQHYSLTNGVITIRWILLGPSPTVYASTLTM